MAEVDNLRQMILTRIPGATRDIVDLELRAVVTEFLSRSMAWRRKFAFMTIPGESGYVLPPPQPGVGMASLLLCWHDGNRMGVGSTLAYGPREGTPQIAYLRDFLTIELWPTPTEVKRIDFVAAMSFEIIEANPTTSFMLPYDVLPFTECLMNGVLTRLYGMLEKPWTSRVLSEQHRKLYNRDLIRARETIDSGRSRGTNRLRFRRFM